ncbi:MAG: tetratricopeptide repeat protein [Bacteroidales bacterium]|nr:tetratricopeptide repeat protein [Bacteroidales bacterium]
MKRLALLVLMAWLLPLAVTAQNKKDAQAEVEVQLASKRFQSQDYEEARDLYHNLYRKKGLAQYFNQYVECLFRLGEFAQAEKELQRFIRSNPNYWKAKVDLVYAYQSEGNTKKADDLFDEILKGIPDNRSSILNLENMFRSRSLNNHAMAILERGAQISSEGYPFYVEKASLYQAMNNYQEAFVYYFKELEAQPDQYKLVKNRFQTLLLYDVNKSIADEMRIALLEKTQQQPDNLEFAKLLVWFSLQEEDYDIALAQCKSIDRRHSDQSEEIINLADICLDNRQYDLAKEAFDYVLEKGKVNPFYGRALVGSIKTENQLFLDRHVTDTRSYERLSHKIDEAYQNIGSKEYPYLVEIQADLMAYHLHQVPEAVALLQQAIEQTNATFTQARLKLKLADIYLYTDEVWEATLLYSQVDKSMKEEPLGHEARFRNAQLRYFIGEFNWAQTQLKVLKAATSKLIANDAMTLSLIIDDNLEYDTTGTELNRLAQADFKIYQHREDEALVILDSIRHNGNVISKPHALYRIAEITAQREDYVEADSLYLQIVQTFPDSYMADDALMQAALIEHQQLKAIEAAKKHYEMLIDQYPTSLYTAQAKKNYRKL